MYGPWTTFILDPIRPISSSLFSLFVLHIARRRCRLSVVSVLSLVSTLHPSVSIHHHPSSPSISHHQLLAPSSFSSRTHALHSRTPPLRQCWVADPFLSSFASSPVSQSTFTKKTPKWPVIHSFHPSTHRHPIDIPPLHSRHISLYLVLYLHPPCHSQGACHTIHRTLRIHEVTNPTITTLHNPLPHSLVRQ